MTALAKRLSTPPDTAAVAAINATSPTDGERTLLRFITCGSVDDGKSTLIGRLLFDANALADDQIATLKADSAKAGQSGEIDYSLLLDGLSAEREQGITIDVAYRYFSTDRRSFIVADTPGHEQYTRNMATGASTADLAIILIDARKGILPQTRRHTQIVAMLGVRHAVLAVNKMDLVGHRREVFETIEAEYRAFASSLGFASLVAVPLSAKLGENVRNRSMKLAWYRGPTLLDVLESAQTATIAQSHASRFVVQWVNRPRSDQAGGEGIDFRGFSGFVASGRIGAGDEVVVQPSGRRARIARIVTYDGNLAHASPGQAVTITLDREVDISRGDVLAAAEHPPAVTQHLDVKLLWMSQSDFDPARSLLLKLGAGTVPARLAAGTVGILDITTGERAARKQLSANDIARVVVSTDAPVVAEAYRSSRELGGFILIDRLTNETVALGMVEATAVPVGGAVASTAAFNAPIATSVANNDKPVGFLASVKTLVEAPSEQARRSLVKALTWRATGSLDTFVLAYLFTGQAKIAAGISIAEIATKIVLYYGHERIWSRIKFGRSGAECAPAPPCATSRASADCHAA
jgi:sulfate adenylyltransferase large subunit